MKEQVPVWRKSLIERGHRNVFALMGGWKAWEHGKFPTDANDPGTGHFRVQLSTR